ncbi:MAG TPA: fumarylacetoacetate hydrolase family protein [Solirubrobacteraceae bacterium]|jgi:2-keto-4-pentenoate hydratase/2-oxohepta-3-ene-1,7-dioic acid hydratase in catechol pathway|nr:fumarylacetoacetate hydrolase family protein [Solirubrobacteraceae bacterium]
MRLVSYDTGDGPVAGVLVEDRIVSASSLDAPAVDVRGLLTALDADGLRRLGERAADAAAGESVALADARLHAPVLDPQKIIGVGLNYRDHAEETGQEIPKAPMWFAKFANSLIGAGEEIVLPSAHPNRVDYEAELALVVGRKARNVGEGEALSYLAGAMPFNDVSARDLQMQNPLWTSGKAIDTFAPCGPALVTLDQIDDLQALTLRTRIDGETVQEGTSANLIFGPAELVSWLSRTLTLLPGDVIATGTPAGVGASRRSYLQDGQTVTVEIDGLGALVNRVRAE